MSTEDSRFAGDSKDSLEFLTTVLRGANDPVWFVENVLGVKTLYPAQEQILRDFYRAKYNPRLRPYKDFIGVGGMRGGKTALVSMIGCYEVFDVVTKPNPQEYWGLLPHQLISISCLAASERQIQDGIYYNILQFLENSEWFNTWYDFIYRASDIECRAKNFKLRTLSSSANTGAGRSNKAVIFDELDLFEGTDGPREAWQTYNVMRKSTVTFGMDGHSFAISSPRDENGIIMTLYKRGSALNAMGRPIQPDVYAWLRPTWELNPYISEADLREEYKFDMDTFYRDFACDPSSVSRVQFPAGAKFYHRPNLLQKDYVASSDIPHVIAIDPAWKNDAYGIAVGYYDYGRGVTVVDGVIRLQKDEDQKYLLPSKVKNYIGDICDNLHATTLLYDVMISPEIVEYCDYTRNMTVEQHIVDTPDYDRWRDDQESGHIEVVYDDMLKYEVERLVRVKLATKIRVDHPKDGSKDMSDCVANIHWFFTDSDEEPQRPCYIGLRGF